MSRIVTVMLAALCGLVAACASTQPAVTYERIDQRKQEIAMLWGQIREWRQNAGLRGVEPSAREIVRMQDKPMSSAINVCPDPVEPRTSQCQDVCSLADAICENAESICRIAGELGNDPWARDKCSSAKASCKEAKQGCCDCCRKEQAAQQGVDAMPQSTIESTGQSTGDQPDPVSKPAVPQATPVDALLPGE